MSKYRHSSKKHSSKKNMKMYFVLVLLVLIAIAVIAFGVLYTVTDIFKPHNNVEPTPTPVATASPTPTPEPTATPSPTPEPVVIDDFLILANYENQLPADFVPNLKDYGGETVDERIHGELTQMVNDANAQAGSLWVASGYRSIEMQQALLDRAVSANVSNGMSDEEALADALLTLAKPGCSDHNLGLAVDFNYVTYDFENTAVYTWLSENAENYGFVQRYKKDKEDITKINYEPWHFRYVGKEHAKKMNELNMCLEEYYEYLYGEK